jgi:membrane fusion protein (multidrug efflux system)
MTTIQEINPIYVDVTQSSASLLRLQRSMASGTLKKDDAYTAKKVKLILEDGTPYPLEGTLQFRDVTVDPPTGSFILRIDFPKSEGLSAAGIYVRAILMRETNMRSAPMQSVSRDPKGTLSL